MKSYFRTPSGAVQIMERPVITDMNETVSELKDYLRTQEKLENYVKDIGLSHWTNFPTVRYFARRYKLKQNDIIDMVESSEVLDLVVGFQIGGGEGYGSFDREGDYRVEYIGEEDDDE